MNAEIAYYNIVDKGIANLCWSNRKTPSTNYKSRMKCFYKSNPLQTIKLKPIKKYKQNSTTFNMKVLSKNKDMIVFKSLGKVDSELYLKPQKMVKILPSKFHSKCRSPRKLLT